MWPVWAMSYPHAKWIIVRRPRQDIINSCLRTGFMRAYTNVEGWGKWVDHHLMCFEQMKEGLDVTEIWVDEVVTGNLDGLVRAIEHCGLEPNFITIRDFIDPALLTHEPKFEETVPLGQAGV